MKPNGVPGDSWAVYPTSRGPKSWSSMQVRNPEAMNAIPIETDFVEIMSAVTKGTLGTCLKFSRKATVRKYAVPAGYPDKLKKTAK